MADHRTLVLMRHGKSSYPEASVITSVRSPNGACARPASAANGSAKTSRPSTPFCAPPPGGPSKPLPRRESKLPPVREVHLRRLTRRRHCSCANHVRPRQDAPDRRTRTRNSLDCTRSRIERKLRSGPTYPRQVPDFGDRRPLRTGAVDRTRRLRRHSARVSRASLDQPHR